MILTTLAYSFKVVRTMVLIENSVESDATTHLIGFAFLLVSTSSREVRKYSQIQLLFLRRRLRTEDANYRLISINQSID